MMKFTTMIFSLTVIGLLGTSAIGCGDKKRYPPTPPPGTQVGNLFLSWKSISLTNLNLPEERQKKFIYASRVQLDAFEKDFGPLTRWYVTDVFVDGDPANNPTYAPCGSPNGGGCFTFDDQRIWVSGGECDNVPYLYHEMYHAYLDANPHLSSRERNIAHQGPGWQIVYAQTDTLRRQICADIAAGAHLRP